MLDPRNRDLTVGHMAEASNVSAVAELNDGFAVIHLAFDWAKTLWHEGDFLQRIADHGDGAFGNFFVLAGQKIVQSLQIVNGMRRILYG
jgi:hypothetical protein